MGIGNDLFVLKGTISVDNGKANTTLDETTQKARHLLSVLNDTETSADDTSDSIYNVGKSANAAAKNMGSNSKFSSASVFLGKVYYKLASAAYHFGKVVATTGFDFNASMESYEKQFAALLKDADGAKQLVANLQEMAKISPLGMEGLAKNAVSLLSAGVELKDIIPTLEMLGNLSLGDTEKMNSVVRAYWQAFGKTRLIAQEMNQFTEAGVPIVKIMTQYGGEKYADGSWYDAKMKDPTFEVPMEDVIAAFERATSEDGEWFYYMFLMMETWNGQVDRLHEQMRETAGAATKPFYNVAKETVLPGVSEALSSFSTFLAENETNLNKWADTLGEVAVSAFDGLLSGFKWVITHGEEAKGIISAIGAAIVAACAATHPWITAIASLPILIDQIKSAVDEGKDERDAREEHFVLSQADVYTGSDTALKRKKLAATDSDALEYYNIVPPDENATDEEFETWLAWQNIGALNRAFDKYLDKTDLHLPIMNENGKIDVITDPNYREPRRGFFQDGFLSFDVNRHYDDAYNQDYIDIINAKKPINDDLESIEKTLFPETPKLYTIFDREWWQMLFQGDTKGNDNFKTYSDFVGPMPAGTVPSSNAVQSEQVSRLEGLVSGLQGKMDTMNSLLSTIAANSTKPMMLDTGIIVGAVNAELGNIVNQNERG